MKGHFLLMVVTVWAGWVGAVQAEEQILSVDTDDTSLIFRVAESGELFQQYYGARLTAPQDLLKQKRASRDDAFEALSTFGKTNPYEVALKVTHADGGLSTDLRYLRHETAVQDDGRTLTRIFLKDKRYDFFVTLYFRASAVENVMESWSEIDNQETGSVVLENMASFDWVLKRNAYWLTHFHGSWAYEMQQAEERLASGIKIVESKKGVRTTQTENPSFMLSLNHAAEEDAGEVIGGALAWSGNYKLCFQVDSEERLHITAGLNPYGSAYHLDPGARFETPKCIFSHSSHGKGPISRRFHRWARKYALRDGDQLRPVLLNSWEGAYFSFDEQKIFEMITDTAKLGAEMFVLDDGWFGNKYPRNNAAAGLGDWQVNTNKLPHGIEPLIDHAEKEGIQFGIWVEPEMVNPKSELAENQPEWIVKRPGREQQLERNQLLLDLSNPAVQDFVFKSVDDLLTAHPRLAYIKWDANRHVQNIGSSYLPADRQSHFWIDYIHGLYDVYDRLMKKHPNVIFQACASGGGRLDYGSLPYHHEFWTSDNTDAWSRIYQQWNTSHFYPAIGMAAHVSGSPNHQTKHVTPLKLRFDVAMTGRLGLELLKDLTPKEERFAKAAVETYKRIRPTIQQGDLYRLRSPYKENRAALMYVTPEKDHAVLFGFVTRFHSRGNYMTVQLQGLDPRAEYRVTEINRTSDNPRFLQFNGSGETFSGDFLMKRGVRLGIIRQYDSAVLELVKTEGK